MWTKEKSKEARNLVDDRLLPHGSVEIKNCKLKRLSTVICL